MKSIRKMATRTKSADGATRQLSRSKSPIMRTATGRATAVRRTKSRGSPKATAQELMPADPRIFCSDLYTEDYVKDEIDKVGRNGDMTELILEDLIARESDMLTQAVQDMLVQTTSSKEEGNKEANLDGSQDDVSKNHNTPSSQSGTDNPKAASKKSRVSPLRSLSSSKLLKASKSSKSILTKPMQRRVWEKITFVDCISDSRSYHAYLQQKHEFLRDLTHFLKEQNLKNDLPICFEAKIELHTLLDATTILELLNSIQRDLTVTRVEFLGALSHTSRVPQEFQKLIDPSTVTVKEVIVILLHYDQESINLNDSDSDNDDGNPQESNSRTKKKMRDRRKSRLDAGTQTVIQQCALIMEQLLYPEDDSENLDGSQKEPLNNNTPTSPRQQQPMKDLSDLSDHNQDHQRQQASQLANEEKTPPQNHLKEVDYPPAPQGISKPPRLTQRSVSDSLALKKRAIGRSKSHDTTDNAIPGGSTRSCSGEKSRRRRSPKRSITADEERWEKGQLPATSDHTSADDLASTRSSRSSHARLSPKRNTAVRTQDKEGDSGTRPSLRSTTSSNSLACRRRAALSVGRAKSDQQSIRNLAAAAAAASTRNNMEASETVNYNWTKNTSNSSSKSSGKIKRSKDLSADGKEPDFRWEAFKGDPVNEAVAKSPSKSSSRKKTAVSGAA